MNYDLLIDLHKGNPRQGPGSPQLTKRAIELAGIDCAQHVHIADIGCGTGSSTLVLAEHLNASIVAVDLFQAFLDGLSLRAQAKGVAHKIKTLACSMEELPFEEGSLDVIWAEGAIYNMGFASGVAYFKRFLKPGGILAVSEITWLTNDRPEEIQRHWEAEYPEIATASEKIKTLESHGYMLKGYFPLPESSWVEHYYEPLERSFPTFLGKHDSKAAQEIVEAERSEMSLFKRYSTHYSYGFYIAQRLSSDPK